jgi:hypothetical protein
MHKEFEARLAEVERTFDSLAGLDRGRLSHIEESVERTREELRGEFGARLAENERAVDALANRPIFDQSQVDRAVEVAIARTRTEARAEFDRALEPQRREFAAQLEALKERLCDALAGRPAFDQSQVDRSVETAAEAAVARTRIEMRTEFDRALEARLEEKGLVFEARDAEFERRAEIAEQRARALEAAIAELRRQVSNDAIRLAGDLRARTRDASLAATTELRSDLESKVTARLAGAEKRAEEAEALANDHRARVRKLEAEVTEARAQLREDAIKLGDDLRARVRDTMAAANAETREEIEMRFAALAERPGKVSIARAYEPDTITRAGSFITYGGALFQAVRDTARRPSAGGDWLCVARGQRRRQRQVGCLPRRLRFA